MEKIKIAIDMDDCISNTLEMDYACARYMFKKYNLEIPQDLDKTYYEVPTSFKMQDGDKFFMDEKKYIMKNNSMYPKVFVKEVVKKLREKGFEIIFITSRKNKFWNGDSYKYADLWLKKYEIEFDKLYASVEDKERLCKEEKVDIIIEDNAGFVSKVNSVGINSILIQASYNSHYNHPLNQFAETWLDVYELLGKRYNFDYHDIIEF